MTTGGGGTDALTSLGTSAGSSSSKGGSSLLGSSGSSGTSLKNLFSSGTDTMNSSMLTALLRILAQQKGVTT